MSTPGRWISFWLVIVACFGFVAFVAATGTRSSTDAESTSFVAPSPLPTTAPPKVGLFIGDSYVAGSISVTQRATFGPRVCNRLSLVCYYDGVPATGYLAEGDDDSLGSYPQRLRSDRSYLPDVVVVEGGRADLGAGSVTQTATTYYRAIRKQFPQAQVVVLEPFWNNAYPPAEVQALRAQVKLAARTARVTFVRTTDWLDEDLMSRDGVTPSAAGHRAIAAKLLPAMRAALSQPA